MELWKNPLKHIEGNFGTGVVAFFLFLKWLFFLNFLIFILVFLFTTLPSILLPDDHNYNCTEEVNSSCSCSETYFNQFVSENNIFLDIIQGTGILERTLFFYGFYSNKIMSYLAGNFTFYYNMPLAYLSITVLYFIFSLIAILRSAAGGFRERLIEGEGQFYQYCNLVLSGWDFCIDNAKAAHMKHKAIFSEIKATLETEKLEEERKNRTRKEKYKIFLTRMVVNLIVLAILAGCGCSIYLIFHFSTVKLQDFTSDLSVQNSLPHLFYEYLPSVTIVSLNIIIPFILKYLISFEKYSPTIELRLSLIRTVFLRLASLIVLYASLLSKISCDNTNVNLPCTQCSNVPFCWETYVGQQILKLLLTDFGTHILLTFLINFPRSLLSKHIENKFVKFIGEQTFDLPKHALDVVYIQTLCWFGMFYAPLISLLGTLLFFFLFYIKKFACLINSKPSPIIYRASRSNSMFMLVLLVSYAFAILPIAYSIAEITPSKSCGPFRDIDSVWNLIVNLFLQTPMWLQTLVFFLSTTGFAIPCFIVMLFLLYYYTAISSANRHMVLVLKNQLILEGHDKQFLLDRLSLFIKQENQKRFRAEQIIDDGRNT